MKNLEKNKMMNQSQPINQNTENNNNKQQHLLIDQHYQPNERLLTNPDNDELPKLGRKKSSRVSFINEVSVTNVENWKQFNHDVSEENEYKRLKKEIREYKALKAQKEKEKCCCEIF